MLVCNLTFKYTLNKNEEEEQNSQIQPKTDEICLDDETKAH